MSTFFHYAAVTLCTAGAALAAGNDAPLRGEKAIAALKQQGAYVSLNAAYTAALYAVEPDRDGGYQAWNARQRLAARFDSKGIQVESAHASIGLRLVGWGYGSALSAAAKPEVAANGERIEYRRGGLVEWYVNEAGGIEQGFTLTDPPAGGKSGELLTITLALRGPLQPELADQGRSILLRFGGKAELRYAGLRAWDALGRDLPARMDIAANEVRIMVDDASAAYPVTIDPAVQQAIVSAPDGVSNDALGASISVSGKTLVAGAPGKNNGTGAAYVFVRNGTAWKQQAELTASDGVMNDFFGNSISVSDNTLVVGADGKNDFAGAVYVFVRSGSTWTQQAELTATDGAGFDFLGGSVSVSGDTLVAGALNKNNRAGAAYVFVCSGTTWTQQAELTVSDGADFDNFGASVSVSGDTLVAGAPGKNADAGEAYVFVRSGSTWTQQAELTTPVLPVSEYASLGYSVSINENTIVAGAPNANSFAGEAYVFARNGTVWTRQAELTIPHGNEFAGSVYVSGNTVVAGDVFQNGSTGAAYVFMRSGTTWTKLAKLTASDGAQGDKFGTVSISGETVVAGAAGRDGATGAAYVFIVPAVTE